MLRLSPLGVLIGLYRNRHRPGWRFLPFIRILTVTPKIWNVIEIGKTHHLLSEDIAKPPTVVAIPF